MTKLKDFEEAMNINFNDTPDSPLLVSISDSIDVPNEIDEIIKNHFNKTTPRTLKPNKQQHTNDVAVDVVDYDERVVNKQSNNPSSTKVRDDNALHEENITDLPTTVIRTETINNESVSRSKQNEIGDDTQHKQLQITQVTFDNNSSLYKTPKKRSIEQVEPGDTEHGSDSKRMKKSYPTMSYQEAYKKAIDIDSDGIKYSRMISPRMINCVAQKKISRIGYKLQKFKQDNNDREGFVEIKSREEADALNRKYPYLMICFSHSRQCRLYSYDYVHYTFPKEFGPINESTK